MLNKFDYINLFISEKHNSDKKDIINLSAKEIEHRGEWYKPEDWNRYKKYVFFKWFYKNYEVSKHYIDKTSNLITKLDLDLTDSEKQEIYKLLPREFTLRRAKKNVEVPYINNHYNGKKVSLEENALFVYNETKLFKRDIFFLKKICDGKLYITPSEIVVYNIENKEIEKIIDFNKISEIFLEEYAVALKMIDQNEKVYISYEDSDLVYASIKRASSKFNIKFFEKKKKYLSVDTLLDSFIGETKSKNTHKINYKKRKQTINKKN